MKRIIQLMRNTSFTSGIVDFYQTFFNNGEHTICYINTPGKDSTINPNLSIPQLELYPGENRLQDIKDFRKLFKEYDYVVIHAMACMDDFSRLAYLLPKSLIRKKLIWIEWGGDLYDGTGSKLTDLLRDRIKSNVRAFVGIFPPDMDYYRRVFPKSKAQVFYAPYCTGKVPEYYRVAHDRYRLEQHRESEPIQILVGHNAKPALNHIPVLRMLEKYRDENIRIVLSLSYGSSKGYADSVQAYAEERFPGKTIILRKMLDRESYYRIIDNIDIAIFNTSRQIALANIHKLVWQKTKLFLAEESPMYPYFLDNGVSVEKYEDIQSMSFADFIKPQMQYDEVLFAKYLDERIHPVVAMRKWEKIYDSLK